MHLKFFLPKLRKVYIIFLITVLFINFSTSELKSSIFKVNDIEISEPFDLNFKKEKVIDKAFENAFKKLIKMIVISDEAVKLNDIKKNEIKNLINSFNIKNESFIKNFYSAKFDVNFNKQNTLLFFERKNIFPSIPKKKNIFILPLLVDVENNSVNLFNKNPFFDKWITNKNDYFLLDYILPTEDIDIINILNQNANSLENYNFLNIIKKYNVDDFIICLIYKENKTVKVLSKININNEEKIESKVYQNINLEDDKQVKNIVILIKKTFEDNWKKLNLINRSVKLPLNISVDANDYKKNIKFEKFLKETEFVSNFFIKNFNSKIINYRIIFNGSPKRFLELSDKNNLLINTNKQIWHLN
ncbi:hypothetical protein IDH30_05335 [Pelagibacterales bacterium SAG-MED15]|nr:hypothetical protein [Pelagibacterales bacterium SAG-MED15]